MKIISGGRNQGKTAAQAAYLRRLADISTPKSKAADAFAAWLRNANNSNQIV